MKNSFHHPYFLTVAAFFLLMSPAKADTSWKGQCTITFHGKATLHNFSGTVEAEPFSVKVSDMENPQTATAEAYVEARVAKMDTGNDQRDQEMRKALGANSHPDISVAVENLTAASTRPVEGGDVPTPTVLPFSITIKGRTLSKVGQVNDFSYDGNRMSFTVTFPMSLSAAGISVPPAMGGMLKVKDDVTVVAQVRLSR